MFFHSVLILDFLSFLVLQKSTSLWSLERQVWIQGPRIPETFPISFCGTSINGNTIFFYSISGAYTYNFSKDTWKAYHHSVAESHDLSFCSTTVVMNKHHEM